MINKRDARVRKWGMPIQALFEEKQVKNYRNDIRLNQRQKSAPPRAVLVIIFLFFRSIELVLVSSYLEYFPSSAQLSRWQWCGMWPCTPRCSIKKRNNPVLVLGRNSKNGGEKILIPILKCIFSTTRFLLIPPHYKMCLKTVIVFSGSF